MFYVNGNVGHGGSIDVIESPHQRSIKPLAVLKQLTYMAAYYVQSNIIGEIGTIYSLPKCLVTLSNS